jgi:hypothetical protein
VLWGEGDSNVAFHDTELFMISAGVMYRFGARGQDADETPAVIVMAP